MTEPAQHDSATPGTEALWLELGTHTGKTPTRLLVLLHGAGSTPETFAPVALAWQFKFPNAAAVVMQGIEPGSTGRGYDWFDPGKVGAEAGELAASAAEVARRVATAQQTMNIDPAHTIIIGFSQGGTVALEMARLESPCAAIVVAHAARLQRPIAPGSVVQPAVHLLHGEFDTQLPAQFSVRAYRALRDAGARVTLDVIADGVHSIGQDMINVGTVRAMQTVFSHRKKIDINQFQASLTLSLDSIEQAEAEQAGGAASKPH